MNKNKALNKIITYEVKITEEKHESGHRLTIDDKGKPTKEMAEFLINRLLEKKGIVIHRVETQ